jgi:hypothetical protein
MAAQKSVWGKLDIYILVSSIGNMHASYGHKVQIRTLRKHVEELIK